MRLFLSWIAVTGLLVATGTFAQPPNLSDAELARQTSDPASSLWLLYAELDSEVTPSKAFQESNQFTFEFQPSLPLFLTPSLRLLNFPDLVLATEGTPQGHQISGVESFSWMSALSPPTNAAGVSWGVGPYLSFPLTIDEKLTPAQWQTGGGAVIAWRTEAFVASALVKSGWTTSDVGEEAGSLQIQYNFQRFFGDGYQVGFGRPRIEYIWNRDGSGGWDIPVGLDVAKIFHLGRLPIKVMFEYDFTVLNNSRWEPEHTFRITIVPVFPDPIGKPIFD